MNTTIKSKLGLRNTNRKGYPFVIFTLTLLFSSLFIGVFAPNVKGQETTFTVTVNDGFWTPTGAGSYSAGEVVTITAGTRIGYNFYRWTVNEGGVSLSNTASNTATFTMPVNNVVVTASWNPIQYTITYTLNGGTNAANNPTSYNLDNSFPISIANPTRSGYEFSGWTVKYADGIEATKQMDYRVPSGTVGNLVLVANWDNSGIRYTVTVEDAYGTPTGVGSYYAGETVTLKAGTREGYTFSYWKTKEGGVFPSSGSTATFTMPESNVVIVAIWYQIQPQVSKYYIRYVGYGTYGAPMGCPGSYQTDDVFPIAIKKPIKRDSIPFFNYPLSEYKFLGWNVTYADGRQEFFQVDYSIPEGTTGDIILEANWAPPGLLNRIKDDIIFIAVIIGVILAILLAIGIYGKAVKESGVIIVPSWS